jgi:hypothetical protein
MIVNFFNKTKPINLLFLSVLLILLFVWSIILENDTLSWQLGLQKGLLCLTLLASFLNYNYIINHNSLIKDSAFAILIFVLLFGLFNTDLEIDRLVYANFFLIISYRSIYNLLEFVNPNRKLFNFGLWIGVATLFEPFSIGFLFIGSLAILLYNKYNWRNFFIPFLGFFIPILFFYTYYFLTDNLTDFYNNFNLSVDLDLSLYTSTYLMYPIIFVLVLGIWSVLKGTSKIVREFDIIKNTWTLLLFHFVIAFLFIVLRPNKNGNEWLVSFFPLSIIIANYMVFIRKKWFKEIVFYCFILLFILMKLL